MLRNPFYQLINPHPLVRLQEQNRHLPRFVNSHFEHPLQFRLHPVGAVPIRLVDDKKVGDLQNTSLQGLDRVARFGGQEHDRRLGDPHDIQLGLSHPHRLDQHHLHAEGVVEFDHLPRRARKSAATAATPQTPDKNAIVGGMVLHPDPVPQHRPARERGRRIDRHHPDLFPHLSVTGDQLVDKRTLAGPRRAGDPDHLRRSAPILHLGHDRQEIGRTVFDEGDKPRQRQTIAGKHPAYEIRVGHRFYLAISRIKDKKTVVARCSRHYTLPVIKSIDDPLYLLLTEWWTKHKWPVIPKPFLPKTGYMAFVGEKPIVAAFLYKTDSSMGILEWYVSNPDSTYEERTAAMNELLEKVFETARTLGIQAIFTSCTNKSLISRLTAHGFGITDTEMTNLIKTL